MLKRLFITITTALAVLLLNSCGEAIEVNDEAYRFENEFYSNSAAVLLEQISSIYAEEKEPPKSIVITSAFNGKEYSPEFASNIESQLEAAASEYSVCVETNTDILAPTFAGISGSEKDEDQYKNIAAVFSTFTKMREIKNESNEYAAKETLAVIPAKWEVETNKYKYRFYVIDIDEKELILKYTTFMEIKVDIPVEAPPEEEIEYPFEMTGTWMRVGDDYAGSIINAIMVEGDVWGKFLRVPIALSVYGFEVGDDKWKDVKRIDTNNFEGKSLSKLRDGSERYVDYLFYMTNANNLQLRVKPEEGEIDKGSVQNWVRAVETADGFKAYSDK